MLMQLQLKVSGMPSTYQSYMFHRTNQMFSLVILSPWGTHQASLEMTSSAQPIMKGKRFYCLKKDFHLLVCPKSISSGKDARADIISSSFNHSVINGSPVREEGSLFWNSIPDYGKGTVIHMQQV